MRSIMFFEVGFSREKEAVFVILLLHREAIL